MSFPVVQDERDDALVKALREGDEQIFARIIDEWSPGMLRVARCYVSSEASAEDVVQEAWLGALRGLANFEGRSRLKTWVLRIVVNIAKTWGERERRAGPLYSPGVSAGPTVDPRRFNDRESPDAGAWRTPPPSWPALPEGEALTAEAYSVVASALAELPRSQRAVIALRDLDGYDASEVCEALGITSANQRVLLHRARAAVRQKVESYFVESAAGAARGDRA
jgi:RNA polymerase sigma-70 factor (ECF subfamily)